MKGVNRFRGNLGKFGNSHIESAKNRLLSVIGIKVLASVVACTGSGNETDRTDTDLDTGIERRDVGVDNDVQVDVVGFDAGVDLADASYDSEAGAEDSEVEISEVLDGMDIMPESDVVTDTDGFVRPVGYLRVRSLDSDAVNIVEGVAGEIDLGQFEICAEGSEVELRSVSARVEGAVSDLPARVTLGELVDSSVLVGFDSRDIEVVVSEDDSLILNDGECVNFDFTTNLPVSPDVFAEWVRFNVDNVLVDTPNIEVIYGVPGLSEVKGVKTIFNSTEGLNVRYTFWDGPVFNVLRGSRDFPVAEFRVCTEQNGFGSIDSLTLRAEIDPVGIDTPLYFDWDFIDSDGVYFDGGFGLGTIISHEEEFRLSFGSTEVLDFGACLSVRAVGPFASEEVNSLRLELTDVNANTDVTVRDPEIYEDYGFGTRPTYFSLVQFVVPSDSNTLSVRSRWPYLDFRDKHFIYRGSRTEDDCLDSLTGNCPIYSLSIEPDYSDSRYLGNVGELNLTMFNGGLGPDNSVTFEVRYLGDRLSTVYYDYPVNSSGENFFEIPVNTPLGGLIYNVEVLTYINNENLYAPLVALDPPYIQFVLTDVTSPDTEVYYNGFAVAGDYETESSHSLPNEIRSPELVFAYPEVWVNSSESGIPETVRLSAIEDEDDFVVNLSNIEFDNRFGDVCIRYMTYTHNSGKFSAPSTPPTLNVAGRTLIPSSWNLTNVTYDFASTGCVFVEAESDFRANVYILNPDFTAITEPDMPWQLELVEMGVATPESGRSVNVVNGFRSGVRQLLSNVNPAPGRTVIITR